MAENLSSFNPGPEAVRKMQLQADISAARNDPDMRNMVFLLNLLIDDIRAQNDRAMVRTVLRNQGKIAALQDLVDIITKDYPGVK